MSTNVPGASAAQGGRPAREKSASPKVRTAAMAYAENRGAALAPRRAREPMPCGGLEDVDNLEAGVWMAA